MSSPPTVIGGQHRWGVKKEPSKTKPPVTFITGGLAFRCLAPDGTVSKRPSGYGMIRWKQAVDGFPDFGMSFGNPDFVRYAEAYGAKGSRVGAVENLIPTLEAAFAGGGAHLVEVPIDYSENTRVLVDELRNRRPDVDCM